VCGAKAGAPEPRGAAKGVMVARTDVGCQADVEEGEGEVERLRAALRAAETEKELLSMRLEAMSRLQELQEEALCAGLDDAHARSSRRPAAAHAPPRAPHVWVDADDGTNEASDSASADAGGMLVASSDAAAAYDDLDGECSDGEWVDADDDVPASAEAARAMVRGWRIKAGEMLMDAEHERASHRREAEANLSALEASARELGRQRQQEKLLEAQLAVCTTERTCAHRLQPSLHRSAATDATARCVARARTWRARVPPLDCVADARLLAPRALGRHGGARGQAGGARRGGECEATARERAGRGGGGARERAHTVGECAPACTRADGRRGQAHPCGAGAAPRR
jgi:hypothetical protein